jgi:NADPH:quinone reductase-like Zn-dependent oxidoreductase
VSQAVYENHQRDAKDISTPSSGYSVVATCSPRNFDLVKSFGADAVFDYNSTTCAHDIRRLTGNQLYHAFDIQSDDSSMSFCAEALSTDTTVKIPIYSRFARSTYTFPREDVRAESTFSFTIMGEAFIAAGFRIDPKPEDCEFGKRTIAIVNALLQDAKIRTHPVDLRPGGLNAVLEGLNDLRQRSVSVLRVRETV